VYFTGADTGYIVGDNGTILKTVNGGKDWKAQKSGILGEELHTQYFGNAPTCEELRSVYFVNDNTGYAVGYYFDESETGILIKTLDGGKNWTDMTIGTVQIFLHSIYFTNANNGYIVGDGGTVLKTIDGGKSWTKQESGTTDDLSSVYFTSPGSGYAVGMKGTILKTTSGKY
jgi:photosystem II stability/assembly factor-like uncharacterized protein